MQINPTYYSKTKADFVLTQASTEDSNEALLKILTSKPPLKVLNLKQGTFDLNQMSFIL